GVTGSANPADALGGCVAPLQEAAAHRAVGDGLVASAASLPGSMVEGLVYPSQQSSGWSSGPPRPPPLHELGEQRAARALRVPAAVADVVGQTLARLLRDAVDQALQVRSSRLSFSRTESETSDPYDPWADDPDEETWSEAHGLHVPEESRTGRAGPPPWKPLLGVLVGVGGLAWLLGKRSGPRGVLGAGGLLFVTWWGSRWPGGGLMDVVADLFTLDRLLQALAAFLAPRP